MSNTYYINSSSLEHIPCMLAGLLYGNFCAWAESIQSAVGVADRRGKNKSSSCSSCGHCLSIPGQPKHALCRFCQFTVQSPLELTKVPESPDRAVFVPTTTTTDRQTDYFTPYACTRGNCQLNMSPDYITRQTTCYVMDKHKIYTCSHRCNTQHAINSVTHS